MEAGDKSSKTLASVEISADGRLRESEERKDGTAVSGRSQEDVAAATMSLSDLQKMQKQKLVHRKIGPELVHIISRVTTCFWRFLIFAADRDKAVATDKTAAADEKTQTQTVEAMDARSMEASAAEERAKQKALAEAREQAKAEATAATMAAEKIKAHMGEEASSQLNTEHLAAVQRIEARRERAQQKEEREKRAELQLKLEEEERTRRQGLMDRSLAEHYEKQGVLEHPRPLGLSLQQINDPLYDGDFADTQLQLLQKTEAREGQLQKLNKAKTMVRGYCKDLSDEVKNAAVGCTMIRGTENTAGL